MNSKYTVESVKSALSLGLASSGAKVIGEFPNSVQPMPLTETIISVGADGISVENDKLERLLKGSSQSTVTVGITVCAPKSQTGEYTAGLTDRVINALGTMVDDFTVISISAGKTKYSSTLSALVTEITVTFSSGNAFS